MKKIFKKSRKHSKALYLAVFVIGAIACAFLTMEYIFPEPNNENTDQTLANKYVGRMESIIEYGERITVVAHYPVVGNEAIDSSVLKNVEMLITEFKGEIIADDNSEGELHIDYDSYNVDDKYISIAMISEKNMSTYANVEIVVKNIVYETATGKQLTVGDIIKSEKQNEFVEMLSVAIKQNYSYNDEEGRLTEDIADYISENSKSFYLNKDGVVVTFTEYSVLPGNYGTLSVTLPYEQIKAIFQSDFTVNKVKSQMELQQGEISQNITVQRTEAREIDASKPMVALTFDDGPHPEHTRTILQTLKKYNGAATFYVLGNRASAYDYVLQEIIESGSEIGNHSWSHINYSDEDVSAIRKDKNKVQERVKEIVGEYPATIRAPYGAVNDSVLAGVEMPIVLWSVDTNDWKYKDKNKIVEEATKGIKDGDIILLHDIWEETAAAVPDIAKALNDKGFQLVTVSEMAEAKNVEMENGKKYFSFK